VTALFLHRWFARSQLARDLLVEEAGDDPGHHIPLIVENVRGAQKWVGQARWNFGSFYLWGDVPALMPMVKKAVKVGGITFSGYGTLGYKGAAFNGTAQKRLVAEGRKGFAARLGESDHAKTGSKSNARKAASAAIAKIPFVLASYIGRTYKTA